MTTFLDRRAPLLYFVDPRSDAVTTLDVWSASFSTWSGAFGARLRAWLLAEAEGAALDEATVRWTKRLDRLQALAGWRTAGDARGHGGAVESRDEASAAMRAQPEAPLTSTALSASLPSAPLQRDASREALAASLLDAVAGGLPSVPPPLGEPLVERASLHRLLRLDRPSTCFVELTAQCNERCTHCYAGSSPEMTDALPLETLERVVRDAHALGFQRIQYTGGDPLISPSLFPLVELADELGVPTIEIYTNALALNGPMLEKLLSHRCSFAVSLYSYDPETHDGITQTRKSHARTSENVRRAVARGAEVRVSIVIMEPNRDHLDQTIAYVRDELGVAEGNIGWDIVHEVGRGEVVDGLQVPQSSPLQAHAGTIGPPALDAASPAEAPEGADRSGAGSATRTDSTTPSEAGEPAVDP